VDDLVKAVKVGSKKRKADKTEEIVETVKTVE
jgi:hypothetical protein